MGKGFRILIVLAACLLLVSQAYAAARPDGKKGIYFVQGLTGGLAGALDSLAPTGDGNTVSDDGTPNQYDLIDGDAAIVGIISGTTVEFSFYVLDADATAAESSPDVIRPDAYTTAGVWRLALLPSETLPLLQDLLGAVTDSQVPDDITINLAGEATTVTATAHDGSNETVYVVLFDGTTGAQGAETHTGIYYNPSTGVLSTSGGFNVPATPYGGQLNRYYEASVNGSNYVGWGSPASNNNDLVLLIPTADPITGQVLTCATPSSVTFSDNVARDASVCSWVDQTTDTNTQLTQEQVEDFVGAMLAGSETGITVTYDDTGGLINFVVSAPTDFSNAADLDSGGSLNTNSVSYPETDGAYKSKILVGDPDLWSLTTALHYGGTLSASADGEDTLNAVAVDMALTLIADDGVTAVYNPNAADTIIRNGVSLAQGEALVTSASFGICVLQYRAANTWNAICDDGMVEETP